MNLFIDYNHNYQLFSRITWARKNKTTIYKEFMITVCLSKWSCKQVTIGIIKEVIIY